jgi:PucR C-terminal helix-turn-helix domain
MAVNTQDEATAATPLQQLTDALLPDVDRVAALAAVRMRELLPAYDKVPQEELFPIVRANTKHLLELIRDPGADRTEAEAVYQEAGEARAQQGIPGDEMLHAWRIGLEVMRGEAHATAERLGIGKDTLLEFIEASLRWGDVGMLATASAHRDAEFEMARHEQHHRTNLVRGILLATLSPAAIRVQAAGYGLDLSGTYHAVRARPSDELSPRAIERQLGIADGVGPRRGLAALLDGDLVGFVLAPLPGSVPSTVGVGPAAPLLELANSFRLATRAFEGAAATALTGLVAMEQLGLWPAVIADRDVGDELARRIIDPVLAQGTTGEAILETVMRYLQNDLRLEVTAQEMYLHVNTVRYRLRRFEELVGMALRHLDDLVQIWWAIQRHRLAAKPPQAL